MARLTERQRAFCRHLVTGKSATQAAKDAGYSPTYADRQAKQLLEKPQVTAELNRLRAKVDEKAIITAEEVLRGLKDEAQNAESDAARVNAWAHLGKHLGLFTDRTEITLRKAPEHMTDEELEAALQDAGLN